MTDVAVEKENVSGLHTERLNGDWNWLFRKLALLLEGYRKSVNFADYKIWGVASGLWICTKENAVAFLMVQFPTVNKTALHHFIHKML